MAERKLKIPIGPILVDVTEVGIIGRRDGLIEYELEDGSTIRVAVAPTQVLRVDGSYDADGNPMYLLRHGTVINTVLAPNNLRKK